MVVSENILKAAQAEERVKNHISVLPKKIAPLTRLAGNVLRQEVCAERELLPFDRVTMDGAAFLSAKFAIGIRKFSVQGEQEPACGLYYRQP
jgi:molybdopterin molybdotransferase